MPLGRPSNGAAPATEVAFVFAEDERARVAPVALDLARLVAAAAAVPVTVVDCSVEGSGRPLFRTDTPGISTPEPSVHVEPERLGGAPHGAAGGLSLLCVAREHATRLLDASRALFGVVATPAARDAAVELAAGRLLGREAVRILHLEERGAATVRDQRALDAGGSRAFVAGRRTQQALLAVGARDLFALARDLVGRRVGLSLGAGSSRGFAHIGALERLSALGLPVDVMCGSSAGAGIGVVWAAGYAPDRIEELFAGLAVHGVRPTLPIYSMLSGAALGRHLALCAGDVSFDDLRCPFGVVTVDLESGSERTFTAGAIARIVQASCAIPGVYPAVELGGRWYVDGGLLHPVPVGPTRELGADVVVAVDLMGGARLSPRKRRGAPTLVESLSRAVALLHARVREASATGADVVVSPRAPTGEVPGFLAYTRARVGYRELGRQGVDEAMPALRAALPWLGQPLPPLVGNARPAE
jgi:NTE family protein